MDARFLLAFLPALCLLPVSTNDAAVAISTGATLGAKIDNLQFKDIRFLPRSLDDFGAKKAYVLVFTNTTCPLVQRYLPTLNALEKEYRAKDVQFIAINVGVEDSILSMAAQAVQFSCAFPFVKDLDQATVEKLGVTKTPEVVILDGDRKLRYRGRIDDQHRLGGGKPGPSRRDLEEALQEVLTGKEVTVASTPVDGCAITKPIPYQPGEKITYSQHVAPLIAKHCATCHRPGTAAPFSLLTYEQVAGKANVIADVVREQRMPPWYGVADHGKFVNQRGLTAEERNLITHWAKHGREAGDLSKLPSTPGEVAKAPAWQIGEPDLVLSLPEHELPAAGDIPYKYAAFPHKFAEETWIQAMEIRPSNPRVLHHCNLIYTTPKDGIKLSNFITGTVPGSEPMLLDPGMAFHLPKDSSLVGQIHYVSTGKPEKCQLQVAIRFARGVVQKQLRFHLLVDNKFVIPPGEPAQRVAAGKTLERDALGLALFVHMHLRGRDMTFTATYPDGKQETLLMVPNYNFDWQMPYRWEVGQRKFPKGTRLEAVAHYDNSAFNAFNPDPKATVKDGLQTRDEMMNGFVFYYDEHEDLQLTIDPKTGQVVKP